MTTTTKATWTPVWAVRWDGTQLDAFEAKGAGSIIMVRSPGAPHHARWHREQYDARFGATPAEALAKGVAHAQHEIEMATEELRAARALLARTQALTEETH